MLMDSNPMLMGSNLILMGSCSHVMLKGRCLVSINICLVGWASIVCSAYCHLDLRNKASHLMSVSDVHRHRRACHDPVMIITLPY